MILFRLTFNICMWDQSFLLSSANSAPLVRSFTQCPMNLQLFFFSGVNTNYSWSCVSSRDCFFLFSGSSFCLLDTLLIYTLNNAQQKICRELCLCAPLSSLMSFYWLSRSGFLTLPLKAARPLGSTWFPLPGSNLETLFTW